eukprot:ctg_4499.g660
MYRRGRRWRAAASPGYCRSPPQRPLPAPRAPLSTARRFARDASTRPSLHSVAPARTRYVPAADRHERTGYRPPPAPTRRDRPVCRRWARPAPTQWRGRASVAASVECARVLAATTPRGTLDASPSRPARGRVAGIRQSRRQSHTESRRPRSSPRDCPAGDTPHRPPAAHCRASRPGSAGWRVPDRRDPARRPLAPPPHRRRSSGPRRRLPPPAADSVAAPLNRRAHRPPQSPAPPPAPE